MKIKTDIGVLLLLSKGHQQWPANDQKLAERPSPDFPTHPSEGADPTDSGFLDSKTVR